VFLVNSRYPHFSATPVSSRRPPFTYAGANLLPRLRLHFAEFLGQGSLKRLRMLSSPTCVGLRYGRSSVSTRGFSWKHGLNQLAEPGSSSSLLGVMVRCLSQTGPPNPPTGLNLHVQSEADLPFFVPPASTTPNRCRNIRLLSITYASRHRLRVRLTLGGLT